MHLRGASTRLAEACDIGKTLGPPCADTTLRGRIIMHITAYFMQFRRGARHRAKRVRNNDTRLIDPGTPTHQGVQALAPYLRAHAKAGTVSRAPGPLGAPWDR